MRWTEAKREAYGILPYRGTSLWGGVKNDVFVSLGLQANQAADTMRRMAEMLQSAAPSLRWDVSDYRSVEKNQHFSYHAVGPAIDYNGPSPNRTNSNHIHYRAPAHHRVRR